MGSFFFPRASSSATLRWTVGLLDRWVCFPSAVSTDGKACQCCLPSLCWSMLLLAVFMCMGALIMGRSASVLCVFPSEIHGYTMFGLTIEGLLGRIGFSLRRSFQSFELP